jgi:hypothetical protein
VSQRAIYVNGKRRTASRAPSKGYYVIKEERPRRRLFGGIWMYAFGFGEDFDPKALTLNDKTEVIAYHYWSSSRHVVKSIDTESKTLTLNGLTSHTDQWARYAKSESYYLSNARDGALAPGQWFQDGDHIE